MRILVIGAYGLIGGYVTARMIGDGHEVIGAGRDIALAKRRAPRVRWIQADLARMQVADWRGALDGVGAVVNCAGALQDSPRDDLQAVHVSGAMALARACEAAGVRRFVQISAAGVARGGGAFSATKLEADTAIQGLDLDWVILRPGLVLAPAAFGGSALLRGLAAFPGFVPAVHANTIVQVVSVEDVAEAVARSVAENGPARIVCDLAADEPTRLADILTALRAWLGLAPAPVIALPNILGALSAKAADALAWLGWRSPLRSAAMRQLADGVVAQSGDAERLFGLKPRRLAEILERWPSGVQERWFAHLYGLKPLTLAALALFWSASGVIGFVHRDAAARVLTQAGFSDAMATLLVMGGAAVDLILGGLICARRLARVGLLGALVVTAAYLAGASLWRPDLWGDPLGPLVKTLPTAVLALVALALMDER